MAEWQHAKLLGRLEAYEELREELRRQPRTPVRLMTWAETQAELNRKLLEAELAKQRQRKRGT